MTNIFDMWRTVSLANSSSKNRLIISLMIWLIMFKMGNPVVAQTKWVALFNGKDLSGWDSYIGPPIGDNGKRLSQTAVGFNVDPEGVFSVVSLEGENVIRISGEQWGGINTVDDYANYHLQLKFKWGSKEWGSKVGKKKDSGLLYHAVEPQGANNGPWMRSQEFQIEQGNVGDYWGVQGGVQTIRARMIAEKSYVYDPESTPITFAPTGIQGRTCAKSIDAELPEGSWNTLDLYCFGSTSVHVVNGQVVMVLTNSSQVENKQVSPLTSGKIQIQSEGAEIFYKDLQIQKIAAIPKRLLRGKQKL